MAALRAEFPGLEGRTYLNSCSVGLPPRATAGVYARWQVAMERFEDDAFGALYEELEAFRARLGAFVGGREGSVWLDQNSSALLARVVRSLPRGERFRVVTSDLEFPSAALVFGALDGVELVVVPSERGAVDGARLADAIDDRTWLVFVSHVTTATGAMIDLDPVVARARGLGVWVGLDAYQSVGALPVDLRALDVDFALGGGHKWLLGAWDLGWIWVAPRLLQSWRPRPAGWLAGEAPFTFDVQRALAPDARALGAGAPDPLGSMLSACGLDVIECVGLDVIRARSLRLTRLVMDGSRWPVWTPRDDARRGATVALAVPEAAQVRAALLERGIVVSARAVPGRTVLRVAPHLYNDESEIVRLLEALDEVA